jgi:hypothetical protein
MRVAQLGTVYVLIGCVHVHCCVNYIFIFVSVFFFGCCSEMLSLWILLSPYRLPAPLRDIHGCPIGVGTVTDTPSGAQQSSCWQMFYYVQIYHIVIIKYCSCQAMKQQFGGSFCNMSTNMLINQTRHWAMNTETQNTEQKYSICKDISLLMNIHSTLIQKAD